MRRTCRRRPGRRPGRGSPSAPGAGRGTPRAVATTSASSRTTRPTLFRLDHRSGRLCRPAWLPPPGGRTSTPRQANPAATRPRPIWFATEPWRVENNADSELKPANGWASVRFVRQSIQPRIRRLNSRLSCCSSFRTPPRRSIGNPAARHACDAHCWTKVRHAGTGRGRDR